MSQVLVSENYLSDIADAIREKLDTSDTYKPPQMAAAIRSITGKSAESPFYILNPAVMDSVAAISPHIATGGTSSSDLYKFATLSFAPFVTKINKISSSNAQYYWGCSKSTYNNIADTAVFGRYGYDRSGLIFTTKIPGATYATLHIRYEITSGAFIDGHLQLYLQNALGFSASDVVPDETHTIYTELLAETTIADNEKVIDVSDINDDFYICFVDWSGFTKFRGIWLET